MFKKIIVVVALMVGVGLAQKEMFEINNLEVHFDESTPLWGPFSVSADVVVPELYMKDVVIYCMYVTDSGNKSNRLRVVQKVALILTKNRKDISEVKFEGFRGEHPEVPGEVILSILGQEIVRTLRVQTNFHPDSED
jgi:hypothetical protein